MSTCLDFSRVLSTLRLFPFGPSVCRPLPPFPPSFLPKRACCSDLPSLACPSCHPPLPPHHDMIQ